MLLSKYCKYRNTSFHWIPLSPNRSSILAWLIHLSRNFVEYHQKLFTSLQCNYHFNDTIPTARKITTTVELQSENKTGTLTFILVLHLFHHFLSFSHLMKVERNLKKRRKENKNIEFCVSSILRTIFEHENK